MDKFFPVDGSVFSVNQDGTLTRDAALSDAFASNPRCIIQRRLTHETMLVQGLQEQWDQNTKYALYEPNASRKVDSVKIGTWAISGLLAPRGANAWYGEFIDPVGKVVSEIVKGAGGLELLTRAFLRAREMNTQESALHYALRLENWNWQQEGEGLKSKLASCFTKQK